MALFYTGPFLQQISGLNLAQSFDSGLDDLDNLCERTEKQIRVLGQRFSTLFEEVASILKVVIVEKEQDVHLYHDHEKYRSFQQDDFGFFMTYFWLKFTGGSKRNDESKGEGGLEDLMDLALASAEEHGVPAVIAKSPRPELLFLMDRRDELLQEAIPVAQHHMASLIILEAMREGERSFG